MQTTISNFMKMAETSPNRLENTVEKGEIAPFPIVFSKDLYNRHIKTKACLGKSYNEGKQNYNCHKSATYPHTAPCHKTGIKLYEKKKKKSWKCLNWVKNHYI